MIFFLLHPPTYYHVSYKLRFEGLASVHYFAQTQAIILGGAYMAQKHKSL